MGLSGSESFVINSMQFLVMLFIGIDLMLYPPVLSPALLKKV